MNVSLSISPVEAHESHREAAGSLVGRVRWGKAGV